MSVSAKSTPGGEQFLEVHAVYARHTFRKIGLLMFLLLVATFTGLFAVSTGAAAVSFTDVWEIVLSRVIPGMEASTSGALAETVIFELRLPRIFLAVLTGMSLAGAGTVMQGILMNPLVDPYTLGLSGGAAFGAALAIVLGTSLLGNPFGSVGGYVIVSNAFLFGLFAVLLVYGIARLKGVAPETIILGGVAIGYLFSAGVSALKYLSNNDALKELVVWLMGGMWGASWQHVKVLFPVVLFCLGILLRYAWDMNALATGEETAANLGVNVGKLRMICLIVSALGASATVAFTGIIGFVGLVAPHICRMLIGGDYRYLIPCSCLMGAVLLLVSDTLARTLIAPTEIPVGIITSLIGAPFFVYLLVKRKRKLWS